MTVEKKNTCPFEFRTSGDLLIRPEELQFFDSALEKFIGRGFEIKAPKITELGITVPRHFKVKNEGEIVVEQVDFDNRFFSFVFNNHLLPEFPEEAKILREYLDDPKNKIIVLKRTSPSEKFRRAVIEHSEEHHEGLSILEILAAAQGMDIIHERKNGNHVKKDKFADEEEKSLVELVNIAKESLNFFALTDSKTVNSALDKLNGFADPYEFAFDYFSTMDKIEVGQNKFSLGLLALGIVSPVGLHFITDRINEFTSMFTSQILGESITMAMASADRLIHKLPKTNSAEINLLFSQALNNFGNLPQKAKTWLFDRISKMEHLDRTVKRRALVLLFNVLTASALSYAAVQSGDIRLLLPVAPINTGAIDGLDILERFETAKRISKGLSLEEKQVLKDYIAEKYPRLLKVIVEKNPNLAVAFIDFAHNKPAFYAFLGSLFSLGFLGTIESLAPGLIPREWMMALSGLIFEPGSSLIGGIASSKVDSSAEFEDILPLLYELRTR